MYKLVTIDLDGTLFDNEKNISEENLIAIKKCKELGVKIVIATGRPIKGVYPVLEKLGLTSDSDYVITYNGAKVFNVKTKELILSSTITGKEVKDIYYESQRIGTYFHAFRKNEELITPKKNPYTEVETNINHVPNYLFEFENIKDNDEFLKAMMVDSDENITSAMTKVDKKFTQKYTMVRSAKIFLEFLNKNTDKGKALVALANYLNIDIKDTIAIGDAGNDIPMIERAGLGIAMENSFIEVKRKANFITKTNLESGVAYALNKFIIDENEKV